MSERDGVLMVISGPAGSGKGTAVKLLFDIVPELTLSVSATTRSPRPGEVDGVHYFFISKEEFREKLAAGEILEHTEYCGNYYGTPEKAVRDTLSRGRAPLRDRWILRRSHRKSLPYGERRSPRDPRGGRSHSAVHLYGCARISLAAVRYGRRNIFRYSASRGCGNAASCGSRAAYHIYMYETVPSHERRKGFLDGMILQANLNLCS